MKDGYHIESIPYGLGDLTLKVPKKNYIGTLVPTYQPGVDDESAEILRALQHPIGTSKAWMYSRCLLKAEVIVISDCLDEEVLKKMFTTKAPDLDTAVEMALETQGRDAKILVMRNAADMIPKRNNKE